MSAPAQNDCPSPVSTTALTLSSTASSSKQRVTSSMSAAFRALCDSGRARATVATDPSSILRKCSYPPGAVMLHPEDAVAGLFEGGVRGSREAQSQNHPGVDGIYDAVVPEPRCRVVGVSLPLVLLEDRTPELLALLVCHLLALEIGRAHV